MRKLEKKNFNEPDETRTPPNTKVEVVKVGGKTVLKSTFQPGWKWSQDIKPTAGGEACQVHHFGYQVSGRMHVVASDGTEMEMGPGDIVDIPPGHDAWTVGSEPVVLVDFGDVENYAK
jgi:hypothetical protein